MRLLHWGTATQMLQEKLDGVLRGTTVVTVERRDGNVYVLTYRDTRIKREFIVEQFEKHASPRLMALVTEG